MSWIEVRGQSMRPFLRPGDRIQVDWRPPEEGERWSAPAELLLVREAHSETEWVVHRRIGRDLLKGDASYQAEALAQLQIWGRVCAIQKRGRAQGKPYRPGAWDRVAAWVSQGMLHPWRGISRLAKAMSWLLWSGRRRWL